MGENNSFGGEEEGDGDLKEEKLREQRAETGSLSNVGDENEGRWDALSISRLWDKNFATGFLRFYGTKL